MNPARIEMDFVPRRSQISLPGLLMLAVGVASIWWAYTDHQNVSIASEMTVMSIARYQRNAPTVSEQHKNIDFTEVDEATRQLQTPWSPLLKDLEKASLESGKDVALLEVAPDKNKKNVRISGEARSLPHVLDYISRLQGAASLSSPLLESHEILTSERERPVHFVVLANWRLAE